MTTAAAIPVADNQSSVTAGPRGPVRMQEVPLMEEMAHFNREWVPERVVHAKGAGAYGIFSVTGDLSRYTRAKLLSRVGNQWEVFARVSTVAGELSSADELPQTQWIRRTCNGAAGGARAVSCPRPCR
jgi:catalase